jgi:hypothetical protein
MPRAWKTVSRLSSVVVPASTQIVSPSRSSSDSTPLSAATIIPCAS